MDGYYIAPAFMDKLVVHITKNFLNLPNIKVGELLVNLEKNFCGLVISKWIEMCMKLP